MKRSWLEGEHEVRRKYRSLVEEASRRPGISEERFIAFIVKNFGFSTRLVKTLLRHAYRNHDLLCVDGCIYDPDNPPMVKEKRCPKCRRRGCGPYTRRIWTTRRGKRYEYLAEYFEHYRRGRVKWCYIKTIGRCMKAPSEKEIQEEEAQIKAWREGRLL